MQTVGTSVDPVVAEIDSDHAEQPCPRGFPRQCVNTVILVDPDVGTDFNVSH